MKEANSEERYISAVARFNEDIGRFNRGWDETGKPRWLLEKATYLAMVNDGIYGRHPEESFIDHAIKRGQINPFDMNVRTSADAARSGFMNIDDALQTLSEFEVVINPDLNDDVRNIARILSESLASQEPGSRALLLATALQIIAYDSRTPPYALIDDTALLIGNPSLRVQFTANVTAMGTNEGERARNFRSGLMTAMIKDPIRALPYNEGMMVDELAFYPARSYLPSQKMR